MRNVILVLVSSVAFLPACAPESGGEGDSFAPVPEEATDTVMERIIPGSSGWAHVHDSWTPGPGGSGMCTFCPAHGGTFDCDSGDCRFSLTSEQCTCIGDDPGENTMGIPLGCWCDGTVGSIESNPNGDCAGENLH